MSKGDWLTLGEASRMLGVDPDTLRRWADAGKVEVFVTPGRHRRFSRASIEALIPMPPAPARYRSLQAMGAPPDRVAADLRRRVRAGLEGAPTTWAEKLDEADRAVFRERGREASAVLLRYLNTARRAQRDRLLIDVEEIGRVYGREARRKGLSLGEACEALLFFRAQFMAQIASVARRRSLPPTQSALLFEETDRALDRMLLALIGAHQRASR